MTREPVSEKGMTIRMQDTNTVNRTKNSTVLQSYFGSYELIGYRAHTQKYPVTRSKSSYDVLCTLM
jgi:hypothetical protein